MRTRALAAILAGMLMAPAALAEDADPEMPGDGLDLFAVLDTFAEAESVEDFETRLNDPEAEIVNLDLDANGEVDYVTVVEEVEGTAHVFFLRVPVSEQESQDVAYIAIDKDGEEVTAQAIGDEALYGPDYVVEPETDATGGRMGFEPVQLAAADGGWPVVPARTAGEGLEASAPFDLAAVVVVSSWRVVRVVYAPGYHPWRSPWGWRRYPSHWRVRRPVARSSYRNRHRHRRNSYRRTTVRRSNRASNVHRANRVSSPSVTNRQGSPGSSRPATATTPKATPGNSSPPSTTTTPQKTTQTPDRATSQPNRSRSNQPGRSSPGGPRAPSGPRRR